MRGRLLAGLVLIVSVAFLVYVETGPDPSAREVERIFASTGEGRAAGVEHVNCEGGGRSWSCEARRGGSFSVKFTLGRDGSMSYDVEGGRGPYRACCAR